MENTPACTAALISTPTDHSKKVLTHSSLSSNYIKALESWSSENLQTNSTCQCFSLGLGTDQIPYFTFEKVKMKVII